MECGVRRSTVMGSGFRVLGTFGRKLVKGWFLDIHRQDLISAGDQHVWCVVEFGWALVVGLGARAP